MKITEEIKLLFEQLDEPQQEKILQEFKFIQKKNKIVFNKDVTICPHCESNKIIKRSKYKDTQRFMCK